MPSNAVKELMAQVVEMQIAVSSIKTDIETLKRLVYLGLGVGTTVATGVVITLLTHSFK